MKNRGRYIYAFLVAAGFFLFSLRHLFTPEQDSVTGILVSTTIGSLIVGGLSFLFYPTLLLPAQKLMGNIISNREDACELLTCAPANRSTKYIVGAIGGVVCLYKTKLSFIPHKSNFPSHRKRVDINLSDIDSVSDYKLFFGLYNAGVKVILKSGASEKFVVERTSQFYKDCLSLRLA